MKKKKIKDRQAQIKPAPAPVISKDLRIPLGIMIAVFAFILYAQSIGHNYTLDDHTVIDENTNTKMGFSGIPTILKTDYWYGATHNEPRGPIYRPASLIVFAIVWEFSPNDPHVYHFINVLFYAITCLLLFLVLCKLFKPRNFLFPFVCALLYTAHPIHTEVVNSIKSLDEILCLLFGLTAIWFQLKWLSSRSIWSFILMGISFFLALISKETGITFLLIIPLVVFFFTDTPLKKIGTTFLLLVVITGLWLLIRSVVFKDLPPNTGAGWHARLVSERHPRRQAGRGEPEPRRSSSRAAAGRPRRRLPPPMQGTARISGMPCLSSPASSLRCVSGLARRRRMPRRLPRQSPTMQLRAPPGPKAMTRSRQQGERWKPACRSTGYGKARQ